MKKVILYLIMGMFSVCFGKDREIEIIANTDTQNAIPTLKQEQSSISQKNTKNKFVDNALFATKVAVGSAMFVGMFAGLIAIQEKDGNDDQYAHYKKLFASIGIVYPMYIIASGGIKFFKDKNITDNTNSENNNSDKKKNILLKSIAHLFFGASSAYGLVYLGKKGMFDFEDFLKKEKGHIHFIRGSLALGLGFSVLDNAVDIFKLVK